MPKVHKVHTLVESYKLEEVTLKASDNAEDLTVTQFFELVGELYKSFSFVNKVDIKVKGLHESIPSKIKIRPRKDMGDFNDE